MIKHSELRSSAADPPQAPWWRYGYVWLVIAGPALVVIASMVTIWLAISRPDPVLSEDYYQRGMEINKTLGAAVPEDGSEPSGKTLMPAIQARNHATTPKASPQ